VLSPTKKKPTANSKKHIYQLPYSEHCIMLGVCRLGAAALARSAAAPSVPGLLPSAAVPLASRGYHKNVVDHYENPRNVGSFDKTDVNVGTGALHLPFSLSSTNTFASLSVSVGPGVVRRTYILLKHPH
jgi:hypothetical protein